MPVHGSWIDQETLTGTATLTPTDLEHDWSGGDETFKVDAVLSASHNGFRGIAGISPSPLTKLQAWDQVRGDDPPFVGGTHSRLTGMTDDWNAGFTLTDRGPFGWSSGLYSFSLRVDLLAYDDPFMNDWPDRAIDFEREGPQIWDLRVEAIPTDDAGDRSGASGAYTLNHLSAGSVRVADADIAATKTFPQELLAITPATTVLEYLGVEQTGMQYSGTMVNPLLDALASASPPSTGAAYVDRPVFNQFHNTYVVDVDVTVQRPRYRWIYPSRPIQRIHPRGDGARIFPAQATNRIAGGYT